MPRPVVVGPGPKCQRTVVGQHVRGGGRPSAGAGIIRDVVHGRWGVDIIAVTAIVSAVAVGEYVAALIVVLMLYGGSALEDYASGRAKAEACRPKW